MPPPLLHLEDVSPKHVEFLFKILAVEWVGSVAKLAGDIFPVGWLQCVERGRKQNVLFHGHVPSLAIDEVANGAAYILALDILVGQDALHCLGDAAQTVRSFSMLAFEITDRLRSGRIAQSDLLDD